METSNKPLEWAGLHQLSATPPQAPCLPLRGSVSQTEQTYTHCQRPYSLNAMSDSQRPFDIDETDDENPYGTWVRVEREKKGWTQGQLAESAGLSGQQISNIETGRTRNPQNRTRDKINQALGQQPSQEIVTAEESQVSILNLGALVGFEPYDEDNLPDVRGVYVFYDRTKRPVNVGRATKRPISVRVREHSEKFWFKSPVVHTASYLEITDESLCKQTEQILIKFMRTHLLLNRQGVETEIDDVTT